MNVHALLHYALDYASQGFGVFPLGTYGEGRKHPLISTKDGGHGFYDATADEAQITAWWRATPNANIGLATGKKWGFLVIEDDVRHDGPASLARLAQQYDPLTLTRMVKSGGGGHHHYFKYPDGVDKIKSGDNYFGAEFPGVDVKADGGYIVAPPSLHPNGKRYTLIADAPLGELPSSWLEAMLALQPSKPTLPPHAFDGTERYGGDGVKWLDWALDKKREGTSDFYGEQLAIQLLVNGVAGPKRILAEYAMAATYDPIKPFTDHDIARWLDSAEGSRIVQGGQPARSQASRSGHQERYTVSSPDQEQQDTGGGGDGGTWQPTVQSAADLLRKDLPPVRWAVEGLLPEGVNLLAAKPKKGKSTLMLHIACAIAHGAKAAGYFATTKSDVLYLALEDNERRLQKRLRNMLQDESPPAGLHFAYVWPPLDMGGEQALEAYLDAHPDIHVVVVDTLEHIRPKRRSPTGSFADDYSSVRGLQQMAGRRQLCVVAISHLRKAPADDPFDEINATMGLLASIDNALVMRPAQGIMELHRRGRDYEDDTVLALKGDAKSLLWSVAGKAEEVTRSAERQDIIRVLKDDADRKRKAGKPVDGMMPKPIALALGKNEVTTRRLLMKLLDETKPPIRQDDASGCYLAVEDDPPGTGGNDDPAFTAFTPDDGSVNGQERPAHQASDDERSHRSHRSQELLPLPLADGVALLDAGDSVNTVNGVNGGNGSNGYHPDWQLRVDELVAAGMPEREALYEAMNETRQVKEVNL